MKSPKAWLIELVVKRQIKKLMEDKSMENVLKLLQGKKTYIVAFLFAVISFCEHLGYIDSKTGMELITFLNGLGFATVRSGMKK